MQTVCRSLAFEMRHGKRDWHTYQAWEPSSRPISLDHVISRELHRVVGIGCACSYVLFLCQRLRHKIRHGVLLDMEYPTVINVRVSVIAIKPDVSEAKQLDNGIDDSFVSAGGRETICPSLSLLRLLQVDV